MAVTGISSAQRTPAAHSGPETLRAGDGPRPSPHQPPEAVHARLRQPADKAAPIPVSQKAMGSIVARTHQMDGLLDTQWDTTRCLAASCVAMAAMVQSEALSHLAAAVGRSLRERKLALEKNGADGLDPEGLPSVQSELHAHMQTSGFSLRLAAEIAGFIPTGNRATQPLGRPGCLALCDQEDLLFFAVTDQVGQTFVVGASESGAVRLEERPLTPIEKQAASYFRITPELLPFVDPEQVSVPLYERHFPWFRLERDDSGPQLAREPRQQSTTRAGVVLAFHQLLGRQSELLERLNNALGAEERKLRGTQATLQGCSAPPRQALQRLADSILFVQQRTGHGMNACQAQELFENAGWNAEPLFSPVPFADWGEAAQPGQALLIVGSGHACAVGRNIDGTMWLYDPEGIGGVRTNPCLELIDPKEANDDIRRRYGGYVAVLRLSSCTTSR